MTEEMVGDGDRFQRCNCDDSFEYLDERQDTGDIIQTTFR